ncbi:hypothetical protein OLX02_11520 [Novosphingobium sp. KCTC 2891]|uniref:SO2930 family diheme c-type cytochrome n=1 Tax=Novosphingobium sp. KCTC 2891 TaxID=2989730 RepID=UPI0022225B23|nr:SO2930 family diheme c-type cytochrome [Novosphingobium sp. KCTC 2891]MCW1383449.1 hypothetical protein [Novosphingobium sp. KCTC 2891]
MKRLLLLAAAALALAAANAPGAATPVSDAAILGDSFPQTLGAFGFFADGAAQKPAPGVVPYRLNTPLWSDGAEKLRFLYLPPGTKALARGEGLLDLPVGAALIKTFAFPVNGKRTLIETRVLLHRASGWVALPYRWNEAQTEARLVLAGDRVTLTIQGGQVIDYAVPNKNQCKECHALSGVVTPIGPKARNLSATWLGTLQRAGKLDAVPAVAQRVPVWEEREKAPLALAARGYLEANCAHCHNPQGSASNSGLDLRWEQDDAYRYGVMKRPVAAGRGAGTFEFDVVPGEPAHSILPYRMGSTEGGIAMPELGRSVIDLAGSDIVTRWIAAMKR